MAAEIEGIHAANVTRFFREHVPGADGPLDFEQISGGRSNITYRVRPAGQRTGGTRVLPASGAHAGRDWVLRRPPLGHVLPTAHDMAREYRVITALRDTDVPVPRTLAMCPDPDVNGAPFYVMEYCEGHVVADRLPEGYARSHDERRRMGLAMVDALVRLHAVDFADVGLGDFGRPEGYLERQIRRWSQQWERSVTEPLPEIDELIRRLRAAVPASPAPTIVHGDYRLGNMALDPRDPGHVVAIYDWEMATLGDPLADVGYTLVYWQEPGDPQEAGALPGLQPLPGLLSRAELVAEYARRSGRDVKSVDFYQVLALYKLAVIGEGIYARYLQGKTLGAEFQGMQRGAPHTAARALAIADASDDPRLRG